MVECLDGPARITSKELAPIHSVKSGTLQNACSTRPRGGCRFGEKCSYAHRQVDEQPSKRSKKNDDKSAVAMLKKDEQHDRRERPVDITTHQIHDNWLCLSRHEAAEVDVNLTEELRHAETNPTCEIHESHCTSH